MNIRYGRYLPRLFAYLFDMFLLWLIPLFLLFLIVSFSQTTTGFWINILWLSLEICIFQGIIYWLYQIYTFLVFHGSFGKILGGLYIEKEDGSIPTLKDALMRFPIGYVVSSLAFGLGYLWIIKDPKNKAFHDHIAGTVVTRKHTSVFVFPALVFVFLISCILICMTIKTGIERHLWQNLGNDLQNIFQTLQGIIKI